MVKETLIENSENLNYDSDEKLLKDHLIKKLYDLKDNVERKLIEKDKTVEELQQKSEAQVQELEASLNKCEEIFKVKEARILNLEKELKAFKEDNIESEFIGLNIKLKEELEKKTSEVHQKEKELEKKTTEAQQMEGNFTRVKELVTISVQRIESVKQKEEHYKNLEGENIRLKKLVEDLKSGKVNGLSEENNCEIQSQEQYKILESENGRLKMLLTELKCETENLIGSLNHQIDVLKNTNSNLEQELNNAMDNSEDNESVTGLKEKVKLLTSENTNLEKLADDKDSFEALLRQKEEEISILKNENNACKRKYETLLIDKDKELFVCKDKEAEFKTYFDELEKKSKKFMTIINEQQKEISATRANTRVMLPPSRKPIPGPVRNPIPGTPRPHPGGYANTPRPHTSPADIKRFDLAPSYYSGPGPRPIYPPTPLSFRSPNAAYPQPFNSPRNVPDEALLQQNQFSLPNVMPVDNSFPP